MWAQIVVLGVTGGIVPEGAHGNPTPRNRRDIRGGRKYLTSDVV